MANASLNQPAEIPAELDRWNWGAFLLNWIWGIGNRVFIALLMFVPLVNIVMMFVLGARGSRWAWHNHVWRDAEHFRSVQRKWAIAGVIAWIAVAGLIAAVSASIQFALRSSDVYRMTMDAVRADERVKAAIGEEIETGFWIGGHIDLEGGGTGEARLNIPIRGTAGAGTATSHTVRIIGQWDLRLVVVRVDGSETPVVLINKDDIDLPGGTAAADPLQEAKAAYARGDYATVVELLRRLADQGDAEAQYNLGVMYYEGRGAPQDDAEAMKWYRKSAEQGHVDAQTNLGFMYRKGRGVPRDDVQAMKWFKLAAEQGHAPAQNSVGTAYLRGEGVAQDHGEAARWFRPAAERGLAQAQYNLGLIHEEGLGGAPDAAEAAKWYRSAADQGLADAQFKLGVMYHKGRGVPQDDAEALRWSKLAAEQGYAPAQFNVGMAYVRGEGVSRDYGEAARWFRSPADQGDARAQYMLAMMYEIGDGLEQDHIQAFKWLSLAAGRATSAELRDAVLGRKNVLAANMTAEQIAEAKRLAQEWRPR